MKFRFWNAILGWLLLLAGGCVEPYTPEVLEGPNNFLVVNGFINANGPTTIQLLRTQNLSEETMPPAETRALVRIESENGEGYTLQESDLGKYTIEALDLSPLQQYRVYIRTSSGKEYASDFVEVKQTPAIDAVTWAPVDNEVQLYVSSHDANDDTWYYRWEFESTWQFRPAFYTQLKYANGSIEWRDNSDPEIYNCWRTEYSSTIELGTSVRLNKDVISNYRLLSIPYNSEKIALKYSIQVKQFGLTQEAYTYWETLKKNTESIGTLFAPLPSQLKGNIRSLSDPEELVIGYLTASTMQTKRIFISEKDLPREWRTFIPTCSIDTMLLADASLSEYFDNNMIMPVYEVYPPNGGMRPIGYTYASINCVDCRTRGTNVKPDFWE